MGSIFNPSFLLGLVVLLYLSSFVVFAILRVATGISIQRIGYFSLRRISYTPREGIRIDIRGLGLHLHRPTFAQPTWISLRLEELKVTVNIEELARASGSQQEGQQIAKETRSASSSSSSPKPILRRKNRQDPSRSRAWKELTKIKERLKKLHEKIHWLRLVDVFAINSSFVVEHVGQFELGVVLMLVDTRRKTVDRTRLFQHKKIAASDQRPAEWMLTVRGVLFTPEGKGSLEIIDIATLNIHGLLYKDLPGLRDTSIALKLGRIHIPYDDFMSCHRLIHELKQNAQAECTQDEDDGAVLKDTADDSDRPGSREDDIVQTVSDSKEFVSSILRGVQEVQVAVSSFGLSKSIKPVDPHCTPIYFNIAMNEFGLDLHRLDAKSPAHRMYFSPKDVAHQALIAAISISVSLDEGDDQPERLLYVPMATTTIKTTLPSKTVSFSEDGNTAERNANILFANFVVTSPSIDLDPKHLPVVLAIAQRRQERHERASPASIRSHHILSRLLPKASIKLSVHEPVIRVKLPPATPKESLDDEYDLLISVVSSISFETESSHSDAGELHYSLNSSLRLSSHQFYYQTAWGERHDLLLADAIELRTQISANPSVCVAASANFQTLSVHMVRSEISTGVRQIFQQIKARHHHRDEEKVARSKPRDPDFLRPLPTWLTQFSISGSNWDIDVAGVDDKVCDDTRGVALQLESWNAEYKLKRDVENDRPPSRRLTTKRTPPLVEPSILVTPPMEEGNENGKGTDGRRLAIHLYGLQGFVMEANEATEHESFISLPRFEVAFSTSSDHEGPIFHINSYAKALYLHYSLYRFYTLGLAAAVIRKAFALDVRHDAPIQPSRQAIDNNVPTSNSKRGGRHELVTIDVRTDLLQVKAQMPADPAMMLQLYGVEAGQHRWAKPFLRSKLVRLYAVAPQLSDSWTRIMSLKTLRVDLREVKRKRGTSLVIEKSFDIAADFIRIGVPHQLVMHKIFDNVVNVAKATEQLKYRFDTGRDDFVPKKEPEKPKEFPRISVRTKVLLFDIEDGAFDWKLGMIYRTGLIEQKQRLAREEALKVKARHLDKVQRQGASRHRHASAQNDKSQDEERSHSEDNRGRKFRSSSTARQSSGSPRRGRHHRGVRYDPEGKCAMSDDCNISVDQAKQKLQLYNARSWKKRIDASYRSAYRGMREIRGIFWGHDEVPVEENFEKVIAMPERPGLMTTLISDLHVILDKPSFPVNRYPDFIHSVGKGMPRDTKYSLLIPMSVQIDMGEARVTLRDYPLPLLHVPAIRPGQSPRLPSWSLKTDFVVAEEHRGEGSSKLVQVQIVPPEKLAEKDGQGFGVDVRRTVSPVKTYSDVNVAINTSGPTSITWGTSLQPAIQDTMMVIEAFTKPQVDPSDRVGFWDKIRLNVHSRVSIAWTGDGDVHLNLKGSRDPYVVTGHGAGFVMVWRKDVKWNIHRDDDPKKFMTVDSGEYVLAIPDFSHQARELRSQASTEIDSLSSSSSSKNSAHFKKTIMKLSGDVRWLAGLTFERNTDDGRRSFDFMPHYDVILKPPNHVNIDKDKGYDAFKGFRSNWLHLSLAIIAPLSRDWRATNVEPSTCYNSVHLTPKFFTHFFDWWSLFSGVMSLPVRQGKLFPGLEKASKKFGRHLATIKYNLLVSPVFITHMYKHKDIEEYSEDLVSATGLKLRLDSFMLDLHQRREEFTGPGKGLARQIKTSAMKINEAQLDFISADLRAVSAKIGGTTAEYIKNAHEDELAALQEAATTADLSRFHIPDNNFEWVDMDDFNELDWILPAETNPETKILPLAYAPRFTYFRQTEHPGSSTTELNKSSAFGQEPTHFCVMSQDNDPRKVQCELLRERISKLENEIQAHSRKVGEQELHVIRDANQEPSHHDRYTELKSQGKRLGETKIFLERMLSRLASAMDHNEPWSAATVDSQHWEPTQFHLHHGASIDELMNDEAIEQNVSDFSNRFVVHNAKLKWNNPLRNTILRYVHQVSQRRGFVYYLSRRAVRFILDIVEEQNKKKHRHEQQSSSNRTASATPSTSGAEDDKEDESDILDRINDLLSDDKKTVDATEAKRPSAAEPPNVVPDNEDISEDFAALNTYSVRLIAPQIQLQSEKNPKSVLLLTTKSMQLQVVQIMDKDRMTDDVSGLVQRRFSVYMDSAQFFVTNSKQIKTYDENCQTLQYGAPQGSSWPPWVPVEANYDFNHHPFGFSRVVSRTSASLRYDKYNTLRLKYNDEVTGGKGSNANSPDSAESRIDRLWLEFPHIRAICDSAQYFTMYAIVLDLLLYSEPLEKVRSERLEKIMLASDFSDLRGAPEMVTNLQSRIRQLEEIKLHFQIHKKYLDRQGWLDNQAIEQDLANCEDELFFMMKAITTSQRKIDDRAEPSQSSPLLRWYLSASEILWHLIHQQETPLMEITLNNAIYDRTDNSDGSNHNKMEIEKVQGLNLLADAIYPEMLGPYVESGKKFLDGQDPKMLRVSWHMLEAIAGIPVLDQFEVDLFPLKVQLERDIGQKLFEYIFPGVKEKGKDGSGGFSPFMVKQTMDDSDDEDSDNQSSLHPTQVPQFTVNGADGVSRPSTPKSSDLRLRPTTRYPDNDGMTSSVAKAKQEQSSHEKHQTFNFFHHSNDSRRLHKPQHKPNTSVTSQESLTVPQQASRTASSTSLSTMAGNSEKRTRFAGLQRSSSQSTTTTAKSRKSKRNTQPSDDLSLMLSRASNYMTLAYVRIPSVVLCLSYKGKGERNIQDVHNFVFRMPVLEYRNKTWSNLDLALRLKKDIIRALISHTGAIIGNKFAHPRPNKSQRRHLRELAFPSSLLSSISSHAPPNGSADYSTTTSETSSMVAHPGGGATVMSDTPSRFSMSSHPRSELSRTNSFASSLREHAIRTSMSETGSLADEQHRNQNGAFGSRPSTATTNKDEGTRLGVLRSSLTRKLTGETQRFRGSNAAQQQGGESEVSEEQNDGSGEAMNGTADGEGDKKKSVLLLGKKILGGLNQ